MSKPRNRLISIADAVREPPRRIVIERVPLSFWLVLIVLCAPLVGVGLAAISAALAVPDLVVAALQGVPR